jgi:hypothetical protein
MMKGKAPKAFDELLNRRPVAGQAPNCDSIRKLAAAGRLRRIAFLLQSATAGDAKISAVFASRRLAQPIGFHHGQR